MKNTTSRTGAGTAPTQEAALGEELRISLRLIESGLAELQSISGSNDFYHAPLLLLSAGLERFMKVTLCLRTKSVEGRYPKKAEIKEYGHDLTALLKCTEDLFDISDYSNRIPAGSSDKTFIQSNTRLHKVLDALSRFAKSARYYNLDVAGGAEPETDSPEDEWARLELEILRSRGLMNRQLLKPKKLDLAFKEIAEELSVIMETLVRAICRLYTIGPLSRVGRVYSAQLKSFFYLRDEDLGQRNYRKTHTQSSP